MSEPELAASFGFIAGALASSLFWIIRHDR